MLKVDRPAVVVMCKAPVPGQVKTRLMRRYSAIEAAKLHAAMATTVITRAERLLGGVVIAADDVDHPFFQRFSLPVVAQGSGDLGSRMERMVQLVFAQGAVDGLLLLGTDAPHMQASRLLQAVEMLKRHEVVVGPVEDGGYDLLAMRAPYALFDGVAWSSEYVLRQTVARAAALSLSVGELPYSFDVDNPEDIDRAVAAGWQMPVFCEV